MLGGFAEFYSGSLATHVKKGVNERARLGLHLGAVPFGYESCSLETCDSEHPGGVHSVEIEAEAVRELFRRYAEGTTTCVQLASWLNREGFRTRNKHRFGKDEAEGRFFTSSSVKSILKNPFFTGRVKHRDEVLDGVHEALVSRDTFDLVQANLTRNAGRSRTLEPRPAREYLLKGLVRCIHCGMPLWAQTYKSGQAYYREHRGSRGEGVADPRHGGSWTRALTSQISCCFSSRRAFQRCRSFRRVLWLSIGGSITVSVRDPLPPR